MTRIDHTNHRHPATPAARKACRDELRAADARIADHYRAFPVANVDPRAAVVRNTTPEYVATGEKVSIDDLQIGTIIVTEWYDNVTKYTEYAEVTWKAESPEGKYWPINYRVLATNHPTAMVGRIVSAGETRAWDEFDIARNA